MSLLLDDRLDISVPMILDANGTNIENIFTESNLIFNEVKGVVDFINGELVGHCAFLVEYNENFKKLIDEIDIDTINKIFIDTVFSTMNQVLGSNIKSVESKAITNIDDLFVTFKNDKKLYNQQSIIFSRWSTRKNNLSGYVILLVNINQFIKLPKFVELIGLS